MAEWASLSKKKKLRIVFLSVASILGLLLVVQGCAYVYQYFRTYTLLEEGVVIQTFTDDDEAVLADFFDFTPDEAIEWRGVEYRDSFQDDCLYLYVAIDKTKWQSSVEVLFSRYTCEEQSVADNNSSSSPFYNITKGDMISVYRNKTSTGKYATVVEKDSQIVCRFFSDACSITDYFVEQVKKGNYTPRDDR